uniref:Uncharacterized protein n=1 Tax=Arundo donax TaxID=35708 RepID=A0A0A9B263_ARUDO
MARRWAGRGGSGERAMVPWRCRGHLELSF